MTLFRLLPLLVLAACTTEAPPATRCNDLQVSNAWIREMPPGPQLTAGYLSLRNPAQQAIAISHFSSPDFGRVELHESLLQDGQMQMRRMDSLVVQADREVELSPGGMHLMLFDPVTTSQAGNKLVINFHCGDTTLSTSAEVRRDNATTEHHHHGHHE